MTQNTPTFENSEIGYLTVRVSTAGGAVPLEGASVNIRGGDAPTSDVIYSLTTNSDGLTPTVPLATPPRSASSTPQFDTPAYAVYNIDVHMDGYGTAFFNNVPVFSGIFSVQPAILVPLIEGALYDQSQYINETGGEIQ